MASVNIIPFLIYVRSEYLYSLKEGFGYFTPATVFAITSNAGDSLKFQIIADDKIMFSDIPMFALANSKEAPRLSEEGCVYNDCPDDNIIVMQYEYLSTIEHCGIWRRDGTFWQRGTYLFTIEWPRAKTQLHLIELEDGNYICWSNEKITWGHEIPDKLPEYTAE